MELSPNYKPVRANGGFLVHIKPMGVYSALCGFAPDSPKGHLIRNRGRWREPMHGYAEPTCPKCIKAYAREVHN